MTFLLFLKIADEKAANPLSAENILPESWQGHGWQELQGKSGDELKRRYETLLADLGNQPAGSPLNLIFGKAQNKIQNTANLSWLINDLIGKETWSLQGTDVKGDAYEQLLSRGAEDTDSLLPPEVIAAEIVEDLQSALTEFAAVADALGGQTAAEVSSSEGTTEPQQP